ncbi:hypothetical protein K9928_004523 [Salmonella enterica subsp. enterica serovar Oranienburg]|nr:hypothetical protein [Salmonella enterica subsp. enterica serovar Oranienburg]
MKKTLIALAVAASAVVSGSAMAWTANGTGGNVELGGTLTPQEKLTPWEVEIGAAATNLDGQIQKGSSHVSLSHGGNIPVLGIRNIANGFKGQSAINPQIDFHGALDTADFAVGQPGQAYLNSVVNDDQGHKIGSLKTVMRVASQANNGVDDNAMLFASSADYGFFGGLPLKDNEVFNNSDAYQYAVSLFPGIADTWSDNGTVYGGKAGQYTFNSESNTYHAYYAAGIPQEAGLSISLDAPAAADAIVWRASLPITVSYQ